MLGTVMQRGTCFLWAATVLVGTLLALPSSAAAAPKWKWSKPTPLPHAPENTAGVSCPTTKFCAATGEVGYFGSSKATQGVFWTTNPRGGSSSWHYLALENQSQPQLSASEEPFNSVSCVKPGSASPYCAATDGFANLWQTGDPELGKPWSQSIPDDVAMQQVSCWPARCGMIDVDGNAVITVGANPQNETNVFKFPSQQKPGDFVGSISCDNSDFCAAVEGGTDKIGWTKDPTGSSPGWRTSTVSGHPDLGQIACPTDKLCVATEGLHHKPALGVSHNPAGGGGTWKSATLPKDDTSLFGITCESASFCAAGGASQGGNGATFVLISTNPAGRASAWHRFTLPLKSFWGLSCPTTSECVAGGWNGKDWAVTVGRR